MIHAWCGSFVETRSCAHISLYSHDVSFRRQPVSASRRFWFVPVCKEKLSACTYAYIQSHTLTILVLTSFSMALTSSAALGTSEDDCRDVSKDEDWERKRRTKSNSMLERLAEGRKRKRCEKKLLASRGQRPMGAELHMDTLQDFTWKTEPN